MILIDRLIYDRRMAQIGARSYPERAFFRVGPAAIFLSTRGARGGN
jgi:hypothetical protein